MSLSKIKRNSNQCDYCGDYGKNKFLYIYEFGQLISKTTKEMCLKCARSVVGKTKEFHGLL